MNPKHLWWIIPVCLIFGVMVGFYVAIPSTVTIDTGENLKELMSGMKNISQNFNDACHNLTYECKCDCNSEEQNKRYAGFMSFALQSWDKSCGDVFTAQYLCMHREQCDSVTNFCKYDMDRFCNSTYQLFGGNLT